jgi:hypothetical protein
MMGIWCPCFISITANKKTTSSSAGYAHKNTANCKTMDSGKLKVTGIMDTAKYSSRLKLPVPSLNTHTK